MAQAFAMFDEPSPGAEVFSLMGESNLPPDDYLTAFLDKGGVIPTRLGAHARLAGR